jgi:peptidoglycan/LPS O-acetylase OafA/YrhL
MYSEGSRMNSPDAERGFRLGYRRWLDGLRGVAILAVLAYHFRFAAGGFLGVDLFFVLSGFLITTILVEEWQRRGAIHLGQFYLRRGLRLLPAFLALLLVGYLAVRLFKPEQAATCLNETLIAGCYVANWPALHNTPMPTLGHTWSLSLEEQFYLIWPVLLYLMLRVGLSRRRILLVVACGIIASASHRLVLHRLYRASGEPNLTTVLRMYTGLDTRADALLVGCLVGLLAVWGLLPNSRRFLAGIKAASILAAAGLGWLVLNRTIHFGKPQLHEGGYTLVALMAGVLIVRMLAAPSRVGARILEWSPLVYVGRLSYSLYLVHIAVIYWVDPTGLGWSYPRQTLLVGALSLAAALISHYGVELPFLRLKHRMSKARSGPEGRAVLPMPVVETSLPSGKAA